MTVTNSYAYNNGGTFYIMGTAVSTIKLDLLSVTTTYAEKLGGMMYVDNPNQSIEATTMTITTSKAGEKGGVFYFN